MMTKTEFEKNGFDIIRYIAAFSVMMLHYASYTMILSDQAADIMDKTRYIALLFPGVVILFAMSGFLIADSLERTVSVKDFLIKRFVRIYPELWLCTVVNLAVVSILVPHLLDRGIVRWLVTQIFGIANTPSCLKGFATGSINGALWTVFVEVQLYVLLALTYRFLQKMKTGGWVIFLAVLAGMNLLCDMAAGQAGGAIAKLIERIFLPYALWFFIGVFCYLKKDRLLSVLKKAFWPLLILYIVINNMAVTIPGYYANIFIGLVLPFMVIGCGYCLPKIRIKCDLSYGMFLYHWIVLNIIVHFNFMNRLPWYVCLLFFIVTTLILAWISQCLVRKIRHVLFPKKC
ncbi:MAG: acyltransferase [Roseburia sp.]|nr:acyltransferase [Roseburia sp.]MCM1242226.1 acyltransferase [Roseburia sp.]